MEPVLLRIEGRHDVSAIPRINPVCEAMVAIVLVDHLLRQKSSRDDAKMKKEKSGQDDLETLQKSRRSSKPQFSEYSYPLCIYDLTMTCPPFLLTDQRRHFDIKKRDGAKIWL